jgi:cytochrome c-type biogenesis protein CcmH
MNRRRFLSGQSGQPGQPGQSRQSDPLFDPSVVQERASVTALDNDPAIKALEHRLKCTCGCNLDIYTCRTTDFTCTYSPALHQEVLALRKEGRSDDQIVEAFVAKYGETILMAPRPVGFNLAGYLVPGLLVTLIAIALAWILVRRSRRMVVVAAAPATAPPMAVPDAAGQERLRRALAEVED